MGDKIKNTYYSPEEIFNDLRSEFRPKNVPELMNYLRRSSNKEKRELFYGAIFCSGLKHIKNHEFFMKIADKEPTDKEISLKSVLLKYYKLKMEKLSRIEQIWIC